MRPTSSFSSLYFAVGDELTGPPPAEAPQPMLVPRLEKYAYGMLQCQLGYHLG